MASFLFPINRGRYVRHLFPVALLFSMLPAGRLNAQIPIEVFAGNHYSVLDIRVSEHFSEQSRFSIFSKNIYFFDYRGKGSFDMLQNLNFNLTHHWGLVSSVRLSDEISSWRNGIRYITESKHLFFTGQLLYDWSTANDRFAYLFIIRQQVPFTPAWYGYYQVDLLGGFLTTGLAFANATQRVRLGVGKGRVQFGYAMNVEIFRPPLTSDVNGLEVHPNAGVFLRKIF
jgi:hypothetical protein